MLLKQAFNFENLIKIDYVIINNKKLHSNHQSTSTYYIFSRLSDDLFIE